MAAISPDLQTYLAYLLGRIFFVINQITIKIGAIEQRSRFIDILSNGKHIGLELGADMTKDLNLDDYLVFDRDQER